MAGIFKLFGSLASLVLIIFNSIFVGPILSTSHYAIKSSQSIPMNSISPGLTSRGLVISITMGLIDATFYGIGLGTSIQAANEFYRKRTIPPIVDVQGINKQMQSELAEHHKRLLSSIAQEKQLLQPLTETTQLLNFVQKSVVSLNIIIKKLVETNETDPADLLLQSATLTKLDTMEKEHKVEANKFETIKTVINKISEDLKALEASASAPVAQPDTPAVTPVPDEIFSIWNQPVLEHFIDTSISNRQLFHQIYLFIFTFSFLIFMHHVTLWILQYMSLRNPQRWSTLSVVMALIIIGQSLALIFLLHMTQAFRPLSPLFLYTVLFLIRSLTSIYHYTHVNQ